MSLVVSGKLIGPDGKPIPSADVIFTAVTTSFVVLSGFSSVHPTDTNADYYFLVEPGNYAINIAKEGSNFYYGAITITDNTVPSTINQLLKQNVMEAELPPDYAVYFQQLQREVNAAELISKASAESAARSAESLKATVKEYATLDIAKAQIASGFIVNDEKFYVRDNSVSNVWMNEYRNAGGVATPTGEKEYSSWFIDAINLLLSQISSIVPPKQAARLKGWQSVVTDLSGDKGLYGADDDGGFHVAGLTGPIQDWIASILTSIGKFTNILPENSLTGYHFMVRDPSGANGVFGVNDNGGVEILGFEHELQSYLSNLVSSTFASHIAGYQFVLFARDLSNTLLAIDDNGGLWVPGLDRCLQDEIVALKNGAESALVRPYNGLLALFADASSAKPVYAVNPVVNAQKLQAGGASIVYNEGGVVKSATLNLIEPLPLSHPRNNFVQRPIPSHVKEVWLCQIGGQSLAAAGGTRVTEIEKNLEGLALVFFGAGGDRGVGLNGFGEGPVTEAALNVFKDGESIGDNRENAAVPGQQRLLNDLMNFYGMQKSGLPAVVSRIDARSGTAYSGLKKGTQVYTDEMTVTRTFVKRVIEQGKIPVIHSRDISHGEKDSEIVKLPGQYKGNLYEWTDDVNRDKFSILTEFGIVQQLLPHTYIDQMGSIARTEKNRGDLIAYDQLDFCLERADASMSVNKTILNIVYPLSNSAGEVHLIGKGYSILGEYQGQAKAYNYNERKNGSGKKWNVPYITALARSGNSIKASYFSPLGIPIYINTRYGVRNDCGYFLENASSKILSVEQSSDNSLVFIFDKAPAQGDYLCCGYTTAEFKYPLVTVSDTSTRRSKTDPDFIMENFCARQRIVIN
jgi:hypothetical protein